MHARSLAFAVVLTLASAQAARADLVRRPSRLGRGPTVRTYGVPGPAHPAPAPRSLREKVRSRAPDNDGIVLDPACRTPGCVAREPRGETRIIIIDRDGR